MLRRHHITAERPVHGGLSQPSPDRPSGAFLRVFFLSASIKRNIKHKIPGISPAHVQRTSCRLDGLACGLCWCVEKSAIGASIWTKKRHLTLWITVSLLLSHIHIHTLSRSRSRTRTRTPNTSESMEAPPPGPAF